MLFSNNALTKIW